MNREPIEKSPYGFQINIPRQTCCKYMIPLHAQCSPCLELTQEEGAKQQIQASILDGCKTKTGSEYTKCVLHSCSSRLTFYHCNKNVK